MNRSGVISTSSGIFLVFFYAVCSFLAAIKYPLPFSPIKNWLSDLGNKLLNPTGAIFYNAGILLTAFGLLLFFLGLSALKSRENKIQNRMILLTQIFGGLGCASMILSAIYTIDTPEQHSLWSAGLYINLGTAFVFSAAALRYIAACPKWLLMLGILAALLDLVSSLFFSSTPVFEWVTVALFLSYVACLGGRMKGLLCGPFAQKVEK